MESRIISKITKGELDDFNWVEESVGTDISEIACTFCQLAILVPYCSYSEDNGETNFYLHQVCAELPPEIEHPQHLGHTLRLDTMKSSDSRCGVCNDSLDSGDVSYSCSDCKEFVLGITCAVKLFPITDSCHPHPLIPVHDYGKFHCVVCRTEFPGISYECLICPSFRVHQDCVSSRMVKIPFHPHELTFVYQPQVAYRGSLCCQICREEIEAEDYAYHCAPCRYSFHTYNCRPTVHSSHKHPLVYVAQGGMFDSVPTGNCYGCGLGVSAPYYVCIHRECSTSCFFLHKICAELPPTMEHHLHPGHALMLSSCKRRIDDEPKWTCFTCHSPWEGGFSYSCDAHASCSFDIDIICATKSLPLKYDFHEHVLFSSHVKPSFACHACNKDNQGPTYQCTTCRFWVHQLCASLPRFKIYEMHPHRLELTYSLPESSIRGNRKQFRCHVCKEEIQPHSWAYHCAGCRYFAHVYNCSVFVFRDIDWKYSLALSAAVQIPVAKSSSVSLKSLFFMDTNQEEDNGLERHSQDAKKEKAKQMLFHSAYETCHRCKQFLASPCNNCAQCKYFLPKSPSELLGFSTLLRGHQQREKGTGGENCGAFSVSSTKFKSVVKISGSVLPSYVKHEGHVHVLSTTYITKLTWCDACENDFLGYGFTCLVCKFTIDTYCALLPGSITHKCDKVHPFKLTYYSIKDVEEYVCEICEEDITTMWFYHCEYCDQSIHSRCIWNHHIKFGPFMIGSENRELTLVPAAAASRNCVVCDKKEIHGSSVCHYSLFSETSGDMIHLQCSSDTKLERI